MPFDLYSPDFAQNHTIPVEFTCDGRNTSPTLRWRGVPDGTRSLVLTVEDPDAPGGTFVHWVLYDLPASADHLDRGKALPKEVKSGINDFGQAGYGGPCPPRGHGTHHYHFTLYALDTPSLGFPAGAPLRELRENIRQHALAEARLTGLYSR